MRRLSFRIDSPEYGYDRRQIERPVFKEVVVYRSLLSIVVFGFVYLNFRHSGTLDLRLNKLRHGRYGSCHGPYVSHSVLMNPHDLLSYLFT